MVEYEGLSKKDRYLFKDRICQMESVYSYETNKRGKKTDVTVSARFPDTNQTLIVYAQNLKHVYDHRIRLRDLVDVRREDGIVLRGTVVEIKPDEDRPYAVSGNGALVWMAAHEFERFVRADAPERAYETLTAVRARISVLEAELTALKLTEEVLEGVYV